MHTTPHILADLICVCSCECCSADDDACICLDCPECAMTDTGLRPCVWCGTWYQGEPLCDHTTTSLDPYERLTDEIHSTPLD